MKNIEKNDVIPGEHIRAVGMCFYKPVQELTVVHENPISCDRHVSNRSLFFANFHLACVAWKYKWAQEGGARDTRRLIFTEYETILHDTTNHDILPCKNSEQFQDSRKASK